MVTSFEFATAARVVFGAGKLRELPAAARQFGRKALLVTGGSPERSAAMVRLLQEGGVDLLTMAVRGEPTVERVQEAAQLARNNAIEFVIGLGGGSAIDAAKAIAAMAVNPGTVPDYLEVIGRAQPLSVTPLPVIAIPTTAGAGAEVTRNAVITSPEHRFKASLRHPAMLPRLALVDPELTFGLPPELTASTGMDALTQVVEPFVSVRANPLVDALCRDGIARAARALPRAFANPTDVEARSDMAYASLLGGMALANAGLGAVHGFAAPIGGMFPAPHGAVCAALLASVVETNLRIAIQQQLAGVIARYAEVARLLTGSSTAQAADAAPFLRQLALSLRIPRLRQFGIGAADLPQIAEKAATSSSMKGNPVQLTREQLLEIIQSAW